MKFRISPVHRIGFAITMLTISLLVFSDILGLMPNKQNIALEQRRQVAESLAIQLSVLAAAEDFAALRGTLQNVIARNPEIQSAALRKTNGQTVARYGNHELHWGDHSEDRSTLTHVKVPISHAGRAWGNAEIRFVEIHSGSLSEHLQHSLVGLIAFVAFAGFLSYILFLRRALRALDPSSVIPDRVRSAFDLMAEGIAIMDEKGHVVLANKALGDHLDIDPGELLGKDLSRLGWKTAPGAGAYPWTKARHSNDRQMGVPLILESDQHSDSYTIFTVNSAPITDSKGVTRGVFTTFDDMTVLEKKNAELSNALDQLSMSKAEIMQKNQELQYLATRDPMTGALNRRALFEKFGEVFKIAARDGTPLTSMMADIDHFKAVNDNYGHAIGDEVIKMVARILQETAGGHGFVGRYGGEEFAVVLPNMGLDDAFQLADKIRKRILAASETETEAVPVKRLTASLGVSLLTPDIDSPETLIDLADQALYQAKTSGRNRVVRSDRLEESLLPPVPAETPGTTEQTGSSPDDDEGGLSTKLTELKLVAEERKLALEQGMLYDAQTGLPNRNLLKEKIDEALARQERLGGYGAVVSLNVGAFDHVVNAYGHDTADAFMKNIAEKLKGHLRITDTIVSGAEEDDQSLDFYRISTSELGILLADLETRSNVITVLGRLAQVLDEPVTINETEFLPRVEMGVALHPLDGEDAETLLRKSSAARQLPQETSADHRFNFFSQRMNDFARGQLQMEAELRRALDNDEFELWYQPKFLLPAGRVTGLEGLIRWRHPEHGVVSPDKFIPVAEQSDLIRKIGLWVIEEGLRQLQAWSGTEFESIHIGVNVSPVQFLETRFAEQVAQAARDADVALQRLDLELTEGVLLHDPDQARSTMKELAELGINLFLDDFGTGYSSLSYLKKLPIHGLKIDRSFTQDIVDSRQEQAIVRSIVDIAEGLDLSLVAEGIENREQLNIMSSLGCDEFQGYFFSKPLPVDELNDFLPRTGVLEKSEQPATAAQKHIALGGS